jgi:hypothetical protein
MCPNALLAAGGDFLLARLSRTIQCVTRTLLVLGLFATGHALAQEDKKTDEDKPADEVRYGPWRVSDQSHRRKAAGSAEIRQ